MDDRVGRIPPAPLAALGGVLAVTAAWWALALWPVADAPAWLERARAACFGSAPGGLPDAEGWTALFAQPAVMLGMVVAIWGRGLSRALRALSRSGPGRAGLAVAGLAILAGAGLAGWRVAAAAPADAPELPIRPAASHPRLDRPAPPLTGLVDQRGEPVALADFRGRAVFVAFAFGHCETVCPLVVKWALEARAALEGEPAVVVVTLDPWRDTPRRLPSLAERWGLGAGEHALSGEPEVVEAVLDAWEVPRRRDRRTGDVVHPPLVYVVDPDGAIAFAATGRPETLVRLADRLQ
ncbi:MAG: SCO family protein [Gemmatimonadota bacterium]|nr:SCO family protein [Gemmatimonadota bacterium]